MLAPALTASAAEPLGNLASAAPAAVLAALAAPAAELATPVAAPAAELARSDSWPTPAVTAATASAETALAEESAAEVSALLGEYASLAHGGDGLDCGVEPKALGESSSAAGGEARPPPCEKFCCSSSATSTPLEADVHLARGEGVEALDLVREQWHLPGGSKHGAPAWDGGAEGGYGGTGVRG